ncbi:MAG: hypothetical protein H6900_09760 [Rhodobacter sp.]|uniref:hypothetical protein n=1 Tax=Pararhodobacter sp. TaxID=2127056 RepID=UPI001E08697B|nr:hypothetical protein [Pararhodobacter sp.]MCB1345510.1 hypothetical protein [Paracoccaceae bacterium]MCC0073562.1 hypothetical protein [Rhodobacter sp.]HPD92107.1 hypothetical protein [Pararhodobacter sp.]
MTMTKLTASAALLGTVAALTLGSMALAQTAGQTAGNGNTGLRLTQGGTQQTGAQIGGEGNDHDGGYGGGNGGGDNDGGNGGGNGGGDSDGGNGGGDD